MRKLHCPDCGAAIEGDDINLETGIARCGSCRSVFSVTDDEHPVAGSSPGKPRITLPSTFTLDDQGGELVLTRRWFSIATVFLTFFVVFWDGFMLVWFGIAITQEIWIMALFGSLHGTVGVVLTYWVIAMYVNRTTIRTDGYELEVSHGPMFWPGSKVIAADDIEQLYCRRRVRHSRNGTSVTYEVNALTKNEVREKLASGLEEDHALFIEQELERFLGIRDRPVRGEAKE